MRETGGGLLFSGRVRKTEEARNLFDMSPVTHYTPFGRDDIADLQHVQQDFHTYPPGRFRLNLYSIRDQTNLFIIEEFEELHLCRNHHKQSLKILSVPTSNHTSRLPFEFLPEERRIYVVVRHKS
jgi:hypothetical protein